MEYFLFFGNSLRSLGGGDKESEKIMVSRFMEFVEASAAEMEVFPGIEMFKKGLSQALMDQCVGATLLINEDQEDLSSLVRSKLLRLLTPVCLSLLARSSFLVLL